MNPDVSIWKDGQVPDWKADKGRSSVSGELAVLSKIMGFSAEELESNRRGSISARQKSLVKDFVLAPLHQGLSRLCISLGLIWAVGCFLASTSNSGLNLDWRFVAILFLFVFIGIFRLLARLPKGLADLFRPQVEHATGRMYLNQRDTSTLQGATDGDNSVADNGMLGFESKNRYAASNPYRRYTLEVDGNRFPIPESLYNALGDDAMNIHLLRVHYLARTGILLSLEPMRQLNAKPKTSLGFS
jgi:hypothetical protein